MSDTQETIDRLRELDQAASPAPWVFTGTKRTGYDTIEPGDLLEGNGLGLIPEIERVCPPVDAELIAEARNAIPLLLEEIDRLTAENTQLLDIAAETWDEGYLDKETEAPEEMIERGLRKRAQNPYRENKGTRQ